MKAAFQTTHKTAMSCHEKGKIFCAQSEQNKTRIIMKVSKEGGEIQMI